MALQGLYNFAYNNDGAAAQVNNLSARVTLGAELRSRSGFSITPMITYDGLGGSVYHATAGQIQISAPFS